MNETFLIIGLGNPGASYQRTRHNAGFLVLDRLAKRLGIRWEKDRARQAEAGRGQLNDHTIILVKPQTYMNNSGQAVGAFTRKYRVPPERVVVVVDDLALEPGSLRIRKGGSAGGHNGLKSIIAVLGDGFPRIRLGIGHPDPDSDTAGYVLEKFPPEEWKEIEPILDLAVKAIEAVLTDGVEAAMNQFNRKSKVS